MVCASGVCPGREMKEGEGALCWFLEDWEGVEVGDGIGNCGLAG